MSATTPTQPSPGQALDAQVAGYVSAVRTALTDLSPDDLDDLTAGMAADLTEMVRERGGALTDHLGDPRAYAAELRAAAGLPGADGSAPVWETWSQRLRQRWDRIREEKPVVEALTGYLVTLRPGWWLLRGLAVAFLIGDLILGDFRLGSGRTTNLPLALAAMGVSVWIGLRWSRPRPRWWSRWLNGALAMVAAVCVINVWSSVDDRFSSVPVEVVSRDPNVLDTANLYVYDAAGHRVDSARIFTAEGQPVAVSQPFMPWIGANPDTDPEPKPELRRKDTFGADVEGVYPRRAAGIDPWAKQGNEIYGWTPPAAYPPLAPLTVEKPPAPLVPVRPSPSISVSVSPSPAR
ncbi:MAG: hypothetical protein IPI32_13950 [Austwickia sp.]|nr:hypothetical protein [Austwickia sp.]